MSDVSSRIVQKLWSKSLLKVHGRAAVVVPDNVLFEGGAGETGPPHESALHAEGAPHAAVRPRRVRVLLRTRSPARTQSDPVRVQAGWPLVEDSANLPEPHILAEEIAEDLRDALGQIESVLADLRTRVR